MATKELLHVYVAFAALHNTAPIPVLLHSASQLLSWEGRKAPEPAREVHFEIPGEVDLWVTSDEESGIAGNIAFRSNSVLLCS